MKLMVVIAIYFIGVLVTAFILGTMRSDNDFDVDDSEDIAKISVMSFLWFITLPIAFMAGFFYLGMKVREYFSMRGE